MSDKYAIPEKKHVSTEWALKCTSPVIDETGSVGSHVLYRDCRRCPNCQRATHSILFHKNSRAKIRYGYKL